MNKIYNRTKIKRGDKVYKVLFEIIYEYTVEKVTAISDRFVELTLRSDCDDVEYLISTNTSKSQLYGTGNVSRWYYDANLARAAKRNNENSQTLESIGECVVRIARGINKMNK